MFLMPCVEFLDTCLYRTPLLLVPILTVPYLSAKGQTISQPYIVAVMSELLKIEQGHKVLEIGTGSGYQAAVLAEMGAEVFSVERIRKLFISARKLLFDMRYFNIHA